MTCTPGSEAHLTVGFVGKILRRIAQKTLGRLAIRNIENHSLVCRLVVSAYCVQQGNQMRIHNLCTLFILALLSLCVPVGKALADQAWSTGVYNNGEAWDPPFFSSISGAIALNASMAYADFPQDCDGNYPKLSLVSSTSITGGVIEDYEGISSNGACLRAISGLICNNGYHVDLGNETCVASGYYLAQGPLPTQGSCGCSSVSKSGVVATGEPILPGSGDEYQSETDYQSGNGLLKLVRSYNSSDPTTSDLGPGWHDNFSGRRIISIETAFSTPPSQVQYVSNIYTDPSDACTQGWAQLTANNSNLSGVTVTGYNASANVCQLSNGQSIPVYSEDPNAAWETGGSSVATKGVAVQRPDGSLYEFNCTAGQCTANSDIPIKLTASSSGYALTAEDDSVETYDINGVLQSIKYRGGYSQTLSYNSGMLASVVDSYGRMLSFNYSTGSYLQLLNVGTPDGTIQYSYNNLYNLTGVTYPTSPATSKQYQYTSTNYPNALTGVVDESQQNFATITYSSPSGFATASALGGLASNGGLGASGSSISYTSTANPVVTDALGAVRTYHFITINGRQKISSISGPVCQDCGAEASTTYDAAGYYQTSTDWNGNVTKYAYDDTRGLETQHVDASGASSQRTTTIVWDATFRLPDQRTVSNASGNAVSNTQWIYNSLGETLARCDIDPANSADTGYACSNTGTVPASVRRATYTYCTTVGSECPIIGLILTTIGPRTDLTQTTSYSYYTAASATNCGTPGAACYQPGDLYQVTDALGHVTTIASYDADGRITRLTDPNGMNTDLTYYPRGWLKTRTVGGAQTSFTYTAYGAVQTITDPDGVTATFGYDAAHRLTQITDALGNTIKYTLDAAGDKTGESVYDSTGTLHKSLTRTFNTLGQLTTVVDGLNHTVFNASTSASYDANGNLVQSTDGLGFQRQLGYDALNRLQQTIDNYNGSDPATKNTTTGYTYDSLDRLTQVTDPSSLNTTYAYDGLSDPTGQTSPDTGATSRTFDAAGNVLTRTDAKGITATNTFDALNRLTSSSYADTTQNVTYSYDDQNSVTGCGSSYPTGRLTRIIEATVTTVFCYDAQGSVIQKQQITSAGTDTTAYSYTAAERLSGIVYPSGTLVSYTRDGDGRIQSVSVTPPGGSASGVVSSVTYQPFGPVSGYTLGNGQTIARTYDANYRLTDLTSAAFNLHVARDAMGDITAIGNAPGANPATETYAYDPLYRLLSVTEASGTVLESVTYNPTGDRLSKTGSGLDAGTYTYNAGTHQLNAVGNNAFSTDADGNTTAMTQAGSTYGFGYSDRNRMTVAQLGGSTIANYTYNALNERIQKVTGTATERYDYNEASQMLGEYGATNRDYIWMDGIPVANIDTSGTTSTIAYVTADQLGTPRAIATSGGVKEWQLPYQGNAFEELQPTSTGYVDNQRSAGEYYDAETKLNDNVNRTRDVATWRFMSSDPTGLAGGINTYTAVENDPLTYVDPLGLTVWVCRDPAFNGKIPGVDHYWLKTDTQEAGMGTAAAGANAGNQYDSPLSPVETTDQGGRSQGPNAECMPVPGADESTVNKLIKPGRPLGYFLPPFNYCHSFVGTVLFQAHGKNPFDAPTSDPPPPAYIPGYGPESKPTQ